MAERPRDIFWINVQHCVIRKIMYKMHFMPPYTKKLYMIANLHCNIYKLYTFEYTHRCMQALQLKN